MVRDGRLELPTSCSQSKRATNCANPGFWGIQFCSRCGQTCGQAVFLTTSTCERNACIAGVSMDCGNSIFRLEGGATRSQTRRDTNFAIPGYSLFCHDTMASGKNKDFSVCGHSCGQNRFCAVFGNRGKSSKLSRCKALRRFALPRPGYGHGTPKAGALPTAQHPVMKLGDPAGRILPNQARYQLRYTRIFNLSHYITAVEKIKELFCLWSLCDQTRSRAAFGNRSRSHKTRSSQGTAQIGQGFCHEALLLYRLPSADASIICDGKTVFLRLWGGRPSWPRAPGGSHRAAFWRSTMRFPLLRPP